MNKSDGEVMRKRLLGFMWLAVVCFFNTIPLFIISVLANLDSVCQQLPRSIYSESPHSSAASCVRSLLEAVGSSITGFVCLYLWCPTPCCLGVLWILSPYHHALADSSK